MTLRIKEEELELVKLDAGGVPVYHYQGKPFTGVVLIYEDEGWLAVEEEYGNGFQEGWVRIYHENGQLEQEYKMHNNVQIPGSFKEWDKEGNLIIGIK